MYENMTYYATTYWNLKWHMFTHWPVTDVAKVGRGSMLSVGKNVWQKKTHQKKNVFLFFFVGGYHYILDQTIYKYTIGVRVSFPSNPNLIGFQKPPKKNTPTCSNCCAQRQAWRAEVKQTTLRRKVFEQRCWRSAKGSCFFVVKLKFGCCSYSSHMVFIWVVCRVGNVNWLKASNIYQQTKRVSLFFGSVRCKNEKFGPAHGRQKLFPWVQMLQKVTS